MRTFALAEDAAAAVDVDLRMGSVEIVITDPSPKTLNVSRSARGDVQAHECAVACVAAGRECRRAVRGLQVGALGRPDANVTAPRADNTCSEVRSRTIAEATGVP
jgi:hypothetical protein